MSIKAMKQAIEAWDACGRYPDSTSDIERLDVAINALRTAIQQAESEPVLFVSPEQARAVTGKNRVHYTPPDNSGRYLPVRATPAGLFVQPLYTHPAPGAPYGYVLVPIKPTAEMMRAWNAATSEAAYLTFTERGYEAMLAASPAQKGGS